MSKFRVQQKAVERHLNLLSNLCIFGGLLFVLWGLSIYFLTGRSLEIWPLRIGISALFVALGFVMKRSKNLSLESAEWILTAAGTVTVLYAFYVTWVSGLDPIWITGTTLIIVGVLNYLTGTKQALTFTFIAISIGALALIQQKPDQLMTPDTVLFNFLTAAALGFFSSIQRNRYLLDLIQLETRQNIVLSTMREGVVLHDSGGRIISANESAPEILGLTMDQILGKSNIDPQWKTFLEDGSVCPPEMHPSSVAQSTGKAVVDFPMKLQKADGSIAWLSISAVPTFEKGKQDPVAIVVTIQDITDKKQKDETIRSQEVSLMLASKLSGLGEMAAGIAHEINNPLAIISGRLTIIKHMLAKENANLEDARNNILTVEQTVFRIAKIVSSMKSLSRQVSDDSFTPSSVSKIIEDVMGISLARLKLLEIDLQITETEDIEFDCHPGQIGQAILNLINNAVDAIEDLKPKWIRVSFEKEDSSIVIRVTDCGKGIPPELRTKILEPFFTTKDVGKGTGLGLSLVQTIVRTHKGHFSINEHSPNTEFVLKLPLSQGQALKNAV